MSAPKGLKKGDTYQDGRTLIVDKVLPDGTYIVHAEGYEEVIPKEEAELKAKIRAEIMAELAEDGEELKCQYCGKVCKNKLGLASHEEHCKENPKNKEGEQ